MKKKLLALFCTMFSMYTNAQTPASSLNFDGVNDYVLLPTTLPSVFTNDFTFEAWVYPTLSSTAVIQMILAKDQYADGNSQMRLSFNSNTFYFRYTDIANVNSATLISPTVAINNWYHIAVVRSGLNHTMYLNGVPVANVVTTVLINNNNPAHPWSIGARKPFAQDPFQGSIDELRIWSIARTRCEINTYKDCEIPSTATGLIANFHFNQGLAALANPTETLLTDASAAVNTGTLINFALSGSVSNWVLPGGVISGSITPLPPPNVNSTISNSLVCSGTSVTLNGTGANTYTWTGGITNGGIFNPTANATYTVTGTNTLTSCTNTAVSSVSVMPAPTMSIAVSNSNVCVGSSATMSILTNALTFTWSVGNQTLQSIAVNPTIATAYSVIATNSLGCTSSSIQVITVKQLPNVSASASKVLVCVGGSSTLTASGANTYTWTNNNAANVTTPVNPTSTTVFTVVGTATNNCDNSATVTVSVFAPTLSVSGPSATCEGTSVTFSANGTTTYSWSTGSTISSTTVTPTVTTTYSVKGTSTLNSVACSTSSMITLVVNLNPTVTASATRTFICKHESATLTATGANSYTWTSATPVYNSTVNVTPLSNQTYTVVGMDANGCTNSNTITVKVAICDWLGIKSNSMNSVKLNVYPNPSNGEFCVSSDQSIDLIISNELGQVVKTLSLTTDDQEVKTIELANGIYFISGRNENGSVKQKIVIAN